MLDDAGYTMGPDGVRIDPKSGKPLDFRFFSRSSDQNSIDIVPYVSGWMQQIGIKLEPQTLNSNKLGNVILAGDYDLFEWGWYPNPDPNYILDIFTCAQRPPDANTYRNSDIYYCNPDYDKLYKRAELGDERHRRGPTSFTRCRRSSTGTSRTSCCGTTQSLEAYSPNWTGFQPQPDPNGDVLADLRAAVVHQHPARQRDVGRRRRLSGGIPAGVWIGILAAVVVIVGGSLCPEAPRVGRGRGVTEFDGRNERG